MHTLYLTKDEQKLFAKLPTELTKELSVEQETMTYEDTPQRRAIRLKQLSVTDSSLKKFLETAAFAGSDQEFSAMITSLDLTKISGDDIAEIMFAIGPDGTGIMILQALEHANSRDAVELACALSLLRHEMLDALLAPTI